ncbi:predicted protein [Uncinocarpus reesii 1704]|uniref:Methyltransferase domain-containing protein n=1 Tax=Uncinocarpus reesii (strain UAMH 1704) TaxID=336963 RepID=C4JNY3_UNCRE|nr:uncharacterized protein UREG_04453 [Uncinocarpus reesii 1704]EEP79607.1 predicted protein [Uncinocarpus reesii 1704]
MAHHHHHHHHHHHEGHSAGIASKNEAYWSENAETIFDQDWIRALGLQIETHLKENLAWMGIDPKQNEGKKMLDYACGDGLLSHVCHYPIQNCVRCQPRIRQWVNHS